MHYGRVLRSPLRLRVVNNLKAHPFNHCQIVIKCSSSFRRHGNCISRQCMITRRPVTWSSTHCYTSQNERLASLRSTLYALGDDDSGRWHDELEIVLDSFATLKKEDILGTCADIDGENTDW